MLTLYFIHSTVTNIHSAFIGFFHTDGTNGHSNLICSRLDANTPRSTKIQTYHGLKPMYNLQPTGWLFTPGKFQLFFKTKTVLGVNLQAPCILYIGQTYRSSPDRHHASYIQDRRTAPPQIDTVHPIYRTDLPLLPQSTLFIYLVNKYCSLFFQTFSHHLLLFPHKMSCIS